MKARKYVPGEKVTLKKFEGQPEEQCTILSFDARSKTYVGKIEGKLRRGDDGIREFSEDQVKATTKKLVGTVDVTPTWESLLPVMLEAHAAGGRRAEAMRLDFVRMARAADGYNQLKRLLPK